VCNQFQEVLADERLPAGEQEHRHPELGEVVDERLPSAVDSSFGASS